MYCPEEDFYIDPWRPVYRAVITHTHSDHARLRSRLIAKAYSGLSDLEVRQVDAFIRKNTIEKFEPVPSVTPELVFELAFESIRLSIRHKSSSAVRVPWIWHWHEDKKIEEANKLENLYELLRE